MSRRRKGSFSRFIGNVLMLMAVVAVAGFIFQSSGIMEKQKPLSVKYNNSTIRNESELVLVWGVDNIFETSTKEYSVKIVPNIANDFDFGLDGEYERFSSKEEYTESFEIIKQDNYFTLKIERELTMEDVLKKAYEGQLVEVGSEIDIYAESYFNILVESKEESIRIGFKKHFIITLDKDGIIF